MALAPKFKLLNTVQELQAENNDAVGVLFRRTEFHQF